MSGPRKDEAKTARLKAALKANMGRRKAQSKARGTAPNHHGRKGSQEKSDG